jgi:hypothetical protein
MSKALRGWVAGVRAFCVVLLTACSAPTGNGDAATEADSSSEDSSTLDAPTPEAGTSLAGSIPCGSATCGTGELCVTRASGVDGGQAGAGTCVAAPTPCSDLHDCTFQGCGACADSVCAPTPAQSVSGRNVVCMGQ